MSTARKPELNSVPDLRARGRGRSEASVGPGANAGATDMDSDALRVLSEEISREFAPQLEHTALVLYDRDPEHLQAQWYVTPEEVAQAQSLFPGGGAGLRQVLRLRRLDQDGRAEILVSVSQALGEAKREGNEDFSPDGSGGDYECELGLESSDGGWILLARSNRVRLAHRSLPSTRTGPVSDDSQEQEELYRTLAAPYDPDGIPVEPALAAVGEPLYPVFPNLELEEDSLVAEGFSLTEKAPEQMQTRGRDTERFPDIAQEAVPDLQTAANAPLAAKLAAMPPPLMPSSPHLGASFDVAGSLNDPRAALSSGVLARHRAPRFDIEIQAELIVQGRASPGSMVELFGRAVPVSDDGRFSIRRLIQDPVLLSLVIGGYPDSPQAAHRRK